MEELTATKIRRHWISIMALSELEDLESFHNRFSLNLTYTFLRRPEIGSIMLRGRTAGQGAPFNMGEATVTRCSLVLENGLVGTGYVLGRNLRKAELVAFYDAVLQEQTYHERMMDQLIKPLEAIRQRRNRLRAAKAEATKVDFFTLVRGE